MSETCSLSVSTTFKMGTLLERCCGVHADMEGNMVSKRSAADEGKVCVKGLWLRVASLAALARGGATVGVLRSRGRPSKDGADMPHGLPRGNFAARNQVSISQIGPSVVHMYTVYWFLGSAAR